MKIILVGSLAKERNFPKDITPETTEVWGFNAIYPEWVPYWSRRFNLHTHENLLRYKWQEHLFDREVDFSTGNPDVPFYTIDKWPVPHRLRGQVIFPVMKMDDEFAYSRRSRYHCGSFDWLVAFAIYLGGSEIAIHGCSLTMEAGEPISARACLEYWCGVADGRGIKVTTAEDSDLFYFYHLVKSDLCYGIDDTPIFEDRRSTSTKAQREKAPYDYE